MIIFQLLELSRKRCLNRQNIKKYTSSGHMEKKNSYLTFVYSCLVHAELVSYDESKFEKGETLLNFYYEQ